MSSPCLEGQSRFQQLHRLRDIHQFQLRQEGTESPFSVQRHAVDDRQKLQLLVVKLGVGGGVVSAHACYYRSRGAKSSPYK